MVLRCISGLIWKTRSCQRSGHFTVRLAHDDAYQRLSAFWIPTRGINATKTGKDDYTQSLLKRAGFLSTAHSGIFHLLPLGLRVQDKLERLIDKHMRKLGASRLALSSITHASLWHKSGRLPNANGEIFGIESRYKLGFLLSPTHEEDITALVAGRISSYRDLPLRLYQISRKYRDEPRPRAGLLRAREFVMKDLYTFDQSRDLALETYHAVRECYSSIFDELKLPYLVAEASSGNMGGNLSHEYHLPSGAGEDEVASCSSCGYQANLEVAHSGLGTGHGQTAQISTAGVTNESPDGNSPSSTGQQERLSTPSGVDLWRGVSSDRKKLISASNPNHLDPSVQPSKINTTALAPTLQAVEPSLDASLEKPIKQEIKNLDDTSGSHKTASAVASKIINLYDRRLITDTAFPNGLQAAESSPSHKVPSHLMPRANTINVEIDPASGKPLDLLRPLDGSLCPKCDEGYLDIQRVVELGHTFFLGTRYSKALGAYVDIGSRPQHGQSRPSAPTDEHRASSKGASGSSDDEASGSLVPVQMGCYGIGVSRIIGAVAISLADGRGLNWPRVMAPFDVVVLSRDGNEEDAKLVYNIILNGPDRKNVQRSRDRLGSLTPAIDIVLDDRTDALASKLHDADLIGFPVIVVLGRTWASERKCEVQCRRLSTRSDVPLEELPAYVDSLLEQL